VSDCDLEIKRLTPPLEPLTHIAVECPKWRHVERLDPEYWLTRDCVEHREHRGLRLAAPCRGDHQRVVAGSQWPDRSSLWLGRCVEPAFG
jgi:hypothetical protein